MDEAQALEAVKKELHHREDSFLLVLDNANRPEDILAFKRHFDGFRWHVLITSRCQGVIDRALEMHINTLPPPMAKALFTNYYSEASDGFDALLDQLLAAIGYNTLLTELFAKNMKELKPTGETMQGFITRLEQGHLFLGKHSFEVQSNYAITRQGRAATTDEILAVLYDVNGLSENEQHYMVILAMLSATSYDVQFIASLFAPIEMVDTTKTLKKLAGLGWLVNDASTYRISPVIQHILLKKHEGSLQPFAEPLIANLNNRLEMDPYGQLAVGTYTDVQPYIAVTDSLFTCLEGYAWYAMSYLCELLGIYYRVTGNVPQAIKYAQKHLDMAKKIAGC